jgi:superfamily II DNA helicase RecQ
MIDKGEGDRVQKQQQRDNLREVIQYCENKVDCRRQLVLQYFGERFEKSQCHRTCDNCERSRKVTMVDRTDYAIKALKLSESLSEQHTLNQLVDMFKGSTAKRYASLQDIPFYGAAGDLSKTEAERILQNMLTNQVFSTMCKSNAHGFVSSYLRIGSKAKDLKAGRLRITLSVCEDEEPEHHREAPKANSTTNKRVKTTETFNTTNNTNNSDHSDYLDDGDDYDLEDSFINDNTTSFEEFDLCHAHGNEDEHDEDNVYASSEHELPERVPSPAAKVFNKLPSQYRQILDRGLGMVILDDDDDDDDDDVQVVGFENKARTEPPTAPICTTIPTPTPTAITVAPAPPSEISHSSSFATTAMTPSPASTSTTANSSCYEALLAWRDSLAMTRKVNAAFILSNSVIGCIARNLPCTQAALAEIPGMTPERCEKYSESILSITNRYT